MADNLGQESHWLAVIGRSCAFLCLHMADMRSEGLAAKGMFLQSLGVSRAEAAAMLGTNDRSLGELQRQQKAKGERGAKKTVGRERAGTRR